MFKNNKKELPVSPCVHVQNMAYLRVLKSAIAKDGQIDFGFSWSVDTAEYDDEYALAFAILVLEEFGVEIVSDDSEVMEYIRSLMGNLASGKYDRGTNNG